MTPQMRLLSHELEGPLGELIIGHLGPEDRQARPQPRCCFFAIPPPPPQHRTIPCRAGLALTCRAARAAALVAPMERELHLFVCSKLASFNAWLVRRITAGAGPVRAVCLGIDTQGHAVATACHLAHCGTRRLLLMGSAPPPLLEAARSISSLTSLGLTVSCPARQLALLDGLEQLRSLHLLIQLQLEQGGGPAATAPATWAPGCPALRGCSLWRPAS